jgi:hypothetical protein
MEVGVGAEILMVKVVVGVGVGAMTVEIGGRGVRARGAGAGGTRGRGVEAGAELGAELGVRDKSTATTENEKGSVPSYSLFADNPANIELPNHTRFLRHKLRRSITICSCIPAPPTQTTML